MSVATEKSQDDRPSQPARPEYRASHPQEEFIVPLLKSRIDEALVRYALPSSGIVNRTALDVGCGRQPFRKQIMASGFTYTGADVRQTPERSVDFVFAIDGEIPEELERSSPFGLVICTELVEHVADWTKTFSNLFKLTDINGIVILTCPFFFPLHEEPYDFWRPTPHALRHFASKAGFRVIECEKAGEVWDVVGTLMGSVLTYPPGPEPASKFVSVIRRFSLSVTRWALRKRIFHALMPLRGSIYLSNIFIIKK